RAAGVPVSILAIGPGAHASMVLGAEKGPEGMPSFRYLSRTAGGSDRARRAAALVPTGTMRLHAHFANDAAALARYVSALTGIPYRVTAHAYDLHQDPFLLDANLAGAERVYTVARVNLETLRARAAAEGWDASKCSVLRCGIDLATFPYREPPPPGR